MTDELPLHLKYRPDSFKGLVGQGHVTSSLRKLLKENPPHAFLFTGPSGCGKTTSARIIAAGVGCVGNAVMELNAAQYNGVEEMRTIIDASRYRAMGDSPNKFFIIDECFHGATPVLTRRGHIPIDQVLIGDEVWNPSGWCSVERHFINRVELPRLVCVAFSDGSLVRCSSDHKFLTLDGWVAAKELTGKFLCKGIGNGWEETQRSVCPNGSDTAEVRLLPKKAAPHVSVRLVQHLFRVLAPKSVRENLFAGMQQQIRRIKTGWKEALGREDRKTEGWTGALALAASGGGTAGGTTNIRQNEEEKSDACSGGLGKNAGNQREERHAPCVESATWRKWAADRTTSDAVGLFGGRMDSRTSNNNAREEGRLPSLLQSGHREPGTPLSGGDRRSLTSLESRYRTRCQKDKPSSTVRVDRVAFYQCGSYGADFDGIVDDKQKEQGYICLHDLQIAKHPSYVAAGVVVHNCHTLSKQAWQPLLKATEEPPPHLYWAFCTTEANKVPETIRTRCHAYELKPVNTSDLGGLLASVAEAEGIEVGDDVLQLCAKEAGGSPRQALVNLSMVRFAKDRQEAYRTLATALTDEDSIGIKLARSLVAGTRWRDAISLVRTMPDGESAESVRLVVVNYVAKALTDAKDDRKVERMLAVLEVFSQPFYGVEKRAPLLLAIGKLVYGG